MFLTAHIFWSKVSGGGGPTTMPGRPEVERKETGGIAL